jgi:hypothetical protein
LNAVAGARNDAVVPTPVRTFVRVRRTSPLLDCVEVAVGAIALTVAYVRDDYPLVAIALELPVLAAIYVALSRPWEAPQLESVVAMPPGAVIGERLSTWAGRIVRFLALGLLIPFFFLGDASVRVILGCIFLASPTERAIRRRAVAKWEDEHHLELLRERRERRPWRDLFRASPPYYVRPRTTPVEGR